MGHRNRPAEHIEALAAELAPEPNAAERAWLMSLERAYVSAPNFTGRIHAILAAGNGPSDRCERFLGWLATIEAEAATAKRSAWGVQPGPSRYRPIVRAERP